METAPGDWDRLIEEHADVGDYVQEYVPVPEEMFPRRGRACADALKRFNINPFGIGRYAGR